MLKLENTEVVGWEHAIRGMRNPHESWEKSDSGLDMIYRTNDAKERSRYLFVKDEGEYEYFLGPNDQKLMMDLRNAGTDHRKFMRMIVVYCDITGPAYWWKEFDTYKLGTVAISTSTMHKIAAKEFTLEDFSCEHLTDRSMIVLQRTIAELNFWRKIYLEGYPAETGYPEIKPKDKNSWWQMIQLLPFSYHYTRTIMLNYEVLANIYKSRRNHKLDEWHTFCDWIEELPYSELITGLSLKDIPISNEIMEEAKQRRVRKESDRKQE